MTRTYRILVVDDHPIVRSGIRALLESEPTFSVVGEAEDGAEAVRLAGDLAPDVVLMDLQMPGVNGIEATRRITAMSEAPKVVVLTTFDTDADIVRALDAGAAGFLLKDAPLDDLTGAIVSAASGETVLAPAVTSRLVDRMRRRGGTTLSKREVEVLELVAEGLSNKEVAHRLHLSEATVKSHLVHCFDKLDVDNRTAAITAALDQGIIRLA